MGISSGFTSLLQIIISTLDRERGRLGLINIMSQENIVSSTHAYSKHVIRVRGQQCGHFRINKVVEWFMLRKCSSTVK